MRSNLILIFILLFFNNFCFSQVEQETVPKKETDSLQVTLAEQGIIIQDSVSFKKSKKEFNPLAPSKAAFYSAILPGMGQIYNKRYWKAPIAWGLIGGSIYMYTFNNDNYQRFRTAFKSRQAGFTDDEFYDLNNGIIPSLDNDDLEYGRQLQPLPSKDTDKRAHRARSSRLLEHQTTTSQRIRWT